MENNNRDALGNALMESEPLYRQVKSNMIRSLTEGEWMPGKMIPSEAKLAKRYGVGISTIRAAISELAAAKVLVRKQGKGTFVSPHTEERSLYRFFHVVKDDGVKELPISELVSMKKGPPGNRVADILQLPRSPRESEVFRIRNILRVSGHPVVVSDVIIPAALFGGLNAKIIRESGTTLYAVYQSRYGINIIRTAEQLRAVKADQGVAEIFGIPAGDPVLEVQRIAYTFNDLPIEVRRSWVNTTDFHYLIDQGGE